MTKFIWQRPLQQKSFGVTFRKGGSLSLVSKGSPWLRFGGERIAIWLATPPLRPNAWRFRKLLGPSAAISLRPLQSSPVAVAVKKI
ncbi:hypothetical protein CBM2608_A50020 [Cupriavidus taiwanensis]|nr:hypothetical protein CBM2608_A50020 [Cupriavidus taiwanensis]